MKQHEEQEKSYREFACINVSLPIFSLLFFDGGSDSAAQVSSSNLLSRSLSLSVFVLLRRRINASCLPGHLKPYLKETHPSRSPGRIVDFRKRERASQ